MTPDERRAGVTVTRVLDRLTADWAPVDSLEGSAEQTIGHGSGEPRNGSPDRDVGTMPLVPLAGPAERGKDSQSNGPRDGSGRAASRDATRGTRRYDMTCRDHARRQAAPGADLGGPGIGGDRRDDATKGGVAITSDR